jgi:hypothetical protein
LRQLIVLLFVVVAENARQDDGLRDAERADPENVVLVYLALISRLKFFLQVQEGLIGQAR